MAGVEAIAEEESTSSRAVEEKITCFGHYSGQCPECIEDAYNVFCRSYRPVVTKNGFASIEICLGHLNESCPVYCKPGEKKTCILNDGNKKCGEYRPARFFLVTVAKQPDKHL